MEIQQSKPYAQFIRALGWQVVIHDRQQYFVKKLPFMGGLMKIQRVTRLPDIRTLIPIVREYHISRIAIEPDRRISDASLRAWCKKANAFVHVIRGDHFLPTKTIQVDVMADTETIFHHFSEAKRRAVRRAEKLGITVEVNQNIGQFIKLKNASAGFLGFITTSGQDKLWKQFAPDNADILMAYTKDKKPVAGILLLYWQGVAYYWIAGAIPQGKKLFAPTLLVWHALQQAKMHNSKTLDFVGVWDEREPTKNLEWKGFTKFKEGFGGHELYYPIY
jgi:hypothetical protein